MASLQKAVYFGFLLGALAATGIALGIPKVIIAAIFEDYSRMAIDIICVFVDIACLIACKKAIGWLSGLGNVPPLAIPQIPGHPDPAGDSTV